MRGRETGEVVAAARYEGGFLPAAASRRHTPAAKGQDLLRKAKKMTNGARTTALPTAGGGREVFGAWVPPCSSRRVLQRLLEACSARSASSPP